MPKHSLPPIRVPSAKNEDQPASRKMLTLVRDELKTDIHSLERKMDAGFKEVRADIVQIKADIVVIKADIVVIKSDIVEIKRDVIEIKCSIDEIKTSGLRTQILLEEQHANNRIVLEGLQALWQRQDRIEQGRR
jgi:CRISPR/Cas system-associated exonuclease Cas4 (RecB family)